MKLVSDFNNSLLKRREVKLVIESENNPTFASAAKVVSDHFKADEKAVAVKKINGKFGMNTFLLEANVYSSEKDKVSIEPKKKEKKSKEGGQ